MTELESTKYKILRFFNEHHVRQNQNLTRESIDAHFFDINTTAYYITALEELVNNKQIDQTSANKNWQIQSAGEYELNRLQASIDQEKNLEASKNLIEATSNINNKVDISKWLTLFVGVGTIIVAVQQCNESSRSNQINYQLKEIQERQYLQQIRQDSISRTTRFSDTIFVRNLSDSSKEKIVKKLDK